MLINPGPAIDTFSINLLIDNAISSTTNATISNCELLTKLNEIKDKEIFLKILTMDNKGLKLRRKKKVENLFNAIEASKTNTLDKFIFGLGIRFVGAKASKSLAKTFKTLKGICNAEYEDLISIPDIGEVMANSIVDYFNQQKNRDLIIKLLELGVEPLEYNEETFDLAELYRCCEIAREITLKDEWRVGHNIPLSK